MKRIAATASIAAIAALSLAVPAVAVTPTSAVVSWGFSPIKYGTPSTSATTALSVPSTGLSLAMAGTPKTSTVRFKWSGMPHNVVILSGNHTAKTAAQIVQVKPVTAASAGLTSTGLPKTTGVTTGNYSYTFRTAGTYTAYCAVAGHYGGGMKMLVRVG